MITFFYLFSNLGTKYEWLCNVPKHLSLLLLLPLSLQPLWVLAFWNFSFQAFLFNASYFHFFSRSSPSNRYTHHSAVLFLVFSLWTFFGPLIYPKPVLEQLRIASCRRAMFFSSCWLLPNLCVGQPRNRRSIPSRGNRRFSLLQEVQTSCCAPPTCSIETDGYYSSLRPRLRSGIVPPLPHVLHDV
jgi:hypothetical protein